MATIAVGGFLNSGVESGDYKQYQDVASITWEDAEAKLQAAVGVGLQSDEGRWLEFYCSKIIGLRKLLVVGLSEVAVSERDSSAWDAVLAHLAAAASESSDVVNVSLVSRFHSQLEASFEWQAAWHEARYQTSVVGILAQLKAIVDGWTELSDCASRLPVVVRCADEAGMQQLEAVASAKELLLRVVTTQAQLRAAYEHHELLISALEQADEHGFTECQEVERCRRFTDVVSGLQMGIANLDANVLEVELSKFMALGLQNHLMQLQCVLVVLDAELIKQFCIFSK